VYDPTSFKDADEQAELLMDLTNGADIPLDILRRRCYYEVQTGIYARPL
jgi:hypothetical protein